jgi:hypothetical protein
VSGLVIDPFRFGDAPRGNVAFVNFAGAGNTSSPISLAKPSGILSGHYALLYLFVYGGSTSVTPPSGFTLLHTASGTPPVAGGTFDVRIYGKLMGGSEPGTYVTGFTPSTNAVAIMNFWSGVDAGDPIEAVTGLTVANGNTLTVPEVAVTNAGAARLGVLRVHNAGASISTPTGMTPSGQGFTASAIAGRTAYELPGVAGTAVARSTTYGSVVDWFGLSLVLRPALL